MTDEQLTAIYNEANGITTKAPPLTTERIFKAMRAMRNLTLEEAAVECELVVDHPPGHGGCWEGHGPVRKTRDGVDVAGELRSRMRTPR